MTVAVVPVLIQRPPPSLQASLPEKLALSMVIVRSPVVVWMPPPLPGARPVMLFVNVAKSIVAVIGVSEAGAVNSMAPPARWARFCMNTVPSIVTEPPLTRMAPPEPDAPIARLSEKVDWPVTLVTERVPPST